MLYEVITQAHGEGVFSRREVDGKPAVLLGGKRHGEAEIEEIDMLFNVTKQVEGHTICALA